MSGASDNRRFTSQLAAEVARREAAPERLESVLAEQVLGERAGEVSRSWRVLRTWRDVNGDAERAHTTGVFVEPARLEGEQPALVVYVDTKACEVDFRANAEVYLARLDAAGLRFSRVTFRQDRRPRQARQMNQVQMAQGVREELPGLTDDEETEVEELVAGLPKSLRESASRAMRMSLRREKQKNS